MTFPKIAILGAGNMGKSLIGGLIKKGCPSSQLCIADPNLAKRTQLHDLFQVTTTADNAIAVEQAACVIFAVKPQNMAEAAYSVRNLIQSHHPLIISIAAGVREETLSNALGGAPLAIVRAMPNTAALLNCAAIGMHANATVNTAQRDLAALILGALGMTVWLENEALLDVVTALSGSGPAYFFYMMDALQQAAEALGLPKETARLLTAQTALGAARMALETPHSFHDLLQQVMSPGGTTEKAIHLLENHHVAQSYEEAIHAAKQRSEELANLSKEKH